MADCVPSLDHIDDDQPISKYLTCEDDEIAENLRNKSKYVKLNVGGALYTTTIATLTKHDNMLRAMFSGRMELQTDEEGNNIYICVKILNESICSSSCHTGWVLIDRSGKHFSIILNFLRDGAVSLPDTRKECLELLAESRLMGGAYIAKGCGHVVSNFLGFI